jgi:hypothetical protein
MKKWDVFISYAREDRESLVEPLARNLERLGVRVWYDQLSLSTGDSLTESIDRGLEQSVFGVLVISPTFLAKKWPKYEAASLLKREKVGDTMIILIWHNVEYEQVCEWSPELAERLPVRSKDRSLMAITMEIIKLVRPDILTNVHKRVASLVDSSKTESQLVKVKELRAAPVQHGNLPDDLLGRIRLIRASLLNVYPHSFQFWLEGFRRDSHPSKNVSDWEHMCAVYHEYIWTTPLTSEQHVAVFKAIVAIASTPSTIAVDWPQIAGQLPEGAMDFLSKMYQLVQPLCELADDLPFKLNDSDSAEPDEMMKAYFANRDKERFPKDLPDDLMRELTQEDLDTKKSRRVRRKQARRISRR